MALSVVLSHLLGVPVFGNHAVHGFFILSGYLMTHIVTEVYGLSLAGFGRFALNRILRLYPLYWVVLGFSVLIVLFYGEDVSREFRGFIYIPNNAVEWLQNASLIYPRSFPWLIYPRLSPPTWALTVEIFYYVLIGIGVTKSIRFTLGCLTLSVAFVVWTYTNGLDYDYRYAHLLAGALPFSLGALLCHFRHMIPAFVQRFIPVGAGAAAVYCLGLFGINCFLCILAKIYPGFALYLEIGLYVNLLINFALIALLVNGELPCIPKKWDKLIGDFSYPIYLMHWQVGLLCSMLLFGAPLRGFNFEGLCVFLSAILVSIALSWLLIRGVDEPIQNLRKKIRPRKDKWVEKSDERSA